MNTLEHARAHGKRKYNTTKSKQRKKAETGRKGQDRKKQVQTGHLRASYAFVATHRPFAASATDFFTSASLMNRQRVDENTRATPPTSSATSDGDQCPRNIVAWCSLENANAMRARLRRHDDTPPVEAPELSACRFLLGRCFGYGARSSANTAKARFLSPTATITGPGETSNVGCAGNNTFAGSIATIELLCLDIWRQHQIEMVVTTFAPCNYTYSGSTEESALLSDIHATVQHIVPTMFDPRNFPGLRMGLHSANTSGAVSIFAPRQGEGPTTYAGVGVPSLAAFFSQRRTSATAIQTAIRLGKRRKGNKESSKPQL